MHVPCEIPDGLSPFAAPVLFAALLAAPCGAAHDSDCAIVPAARIVSGSGMLPPDGVVPSQVYGRRGPAGPRSRAGFRSEFEAVTAASASFNPVSIRDDREYLGGILYDGRQYYYTAARGYAGRDRITARIPVPAGHWLTAFWHTHGSAAPERRYFSDVDTELVAYWSMPLYLADYTGRLRVFLPGGVTLTAGEAHELGLPPRDGYAPGQVVRDGNGVAMQVATRIGRPWEVSAGLANSSGWRP